MKNNVFVAIRASIVFIVLCGILYPLACTGLAQLFMPSQANGSLVHNAEGEVIGSALIGQQYDNPAYFQGRVSSIDYNGAGSGSNNYGPSNPELLQRTKDSIEAWKTANPDVPVSELPIALVTNSGSGLDPHITPASAEVQIPRISKLTGLSQQQLHELVEEQTEGRDLGLFGEPRVNVLELNLKLQAMMTQ
ncbi:K+-transporting ATPase ATPase C chain [Paenibacillus cellulosilyticus]|uniref:Potassium-transporting ATPase KdpC subunit n=1 Tax=Paenibacillus cellulosilyticus TaxID=375489 RepID=A0A2V2Z3K1_9BACL|nr:potassium-transporting ATPase subunit KdpC [Paenibacillus cellulosilyticus]PWW04803.1 K+-transporting ATPase ATPase C chain [Paenibacillus cellulosilyticus]QKS45924.1 potassium-transporting ATPase subunit KdpC [Paenibacillus cellulosilyticus]